MRLEPCQNLGIIRIAIDSLMIGFCGISSLRLLTVQTPLRNDSTEILISQIQTGYPLWPPSISFYNVVGGINELRYIRLMQGIIHRNDFLDAQALPVHEGKTTA